MKLRPEQLPGQLGKGLLPVYVLCGDEPLLLDEAAQQIRQSALAAGYGERQAFQVETGFNWGGWAAGFDSLSLFSSRRLVELRLPTGKPGVEGGKALEAWCLTPPADTLLVVQLPHADRAMQASKWFSALEQVGVVVHLMAPTPEQLPAWIGQRLAQKGLKAGRETLAFLAGRVEGNLLAAHQEIEKLALLLPPGQVSLEEARSAVVDVARYDASDLPEALLKGDAVRYCRIIDGLQAEGEAPPLALWLLAQEVRTLHRLALELGEGGSLPALMRRHRVWESRQPLVGKALKRYSTSQLAHALRQLARTDRAAKGLLGEGAWQMLKQLGLALMGKAGTKPFGESYGY
jgi:DNA polymerase-3 subunit delta